MRERKNYNQYSNYYVDGNAARKIQELPRYDEEEIRRVQPTKRQNQGKKQKVHASIDLFSIFVLTCGIVLTLFTCIEYLKVQSGIVSMNKEIAKLESSLTKLENENQASLAMINTSLDLNYIYQVAINDLGMVYPNENQVIRYESTLSDYVRQYEEIPSSNTASLIDKLLKK